MPPILKITGQSDGHLPKVITEVIYELIRFALERECLMQTNYFHVYFWPAIKWIFAIIITCSFHLPRKETQAFSVLFTLSKGFCGRNHIGKVLETKAAHLKLWLVQKPLLCNRKGSTICAAGHKLSTNWTVWIGQGQLSARLTRDIWE